MGAEEQLTAIDGRLNRGEAQFVALEQRVLALEGMALQGRVDALEERLHGLTAVVASLKAAPSGGNPAPVKLPRPRPSPAKKKGR